MMLSVEAEATDKELKYEWLKAGEVDKEFQYEWLKDGQVIDPKVYPYCRELNSPHLIISPFMPEYEGQYKCRVSNKFDSVESNVAKLSKFIITSL